MPYPHPRHQPTSSVAPAAGNGPVLMGQGFRSANTGAAPNPQFQQLAERNLSTRVAPVAGHGPASLNEAARAVKIDIATEDPVQVMDYSRWEVVDEVLLMAGLEGPPAQVPLLDSHFRWSVAGILGSVREIKVVGRKLVGLAVFDEGGEGEAAFGKVRGGHLTDLSAGYQALEAVWVEADTTAEVEGRKFKGPLRVVTRWKLNETSLCPIGADPKTKVRSASPGRQEEPMDKRLRAFLERRGLAATATEEEAWAFFAKLGKRDADGQGDGQRSQAGQAGGSGASNPPAQDPPPPPPADNARSQGDGNGNGQDVNLVVSEALRAERQRAAEINDMCRELGLPDDLAARLVREGRSMGEARAAVLEEIRQRGAGEGQGPGYRPPARVTSDQRDRFRAAAIDAVALRGGLAVAEPAAGANELRGLSLRELSGECLRQAGVRVPGDPRARVGRALTDSDLPYILGDIANRSVQAGWEGAEETWPMWAGSGTVGDFKTNRGLRLSEFDDLDELGVDGEYNFGKFADAMEEYKIATYGKMFAITRQSIINDDMSMLTDIPRAMGESANRKVGDVAVAALIGNAAMGDAKALFHADHANATTITGIDYTEVGKVLRLMRAQKDMRGLRRIRIVPSFLLGPTALELEMDKFFNTTDLGTTDGARFKNPLANKISQENRVYEPRLDDDSESVFYVLGPKGRFITVFFLNGVAAPYLESKEGWTRDGREYKVRVDAGAKAMDWRPVARASIEAGE